MMIIDWWSITFMFIHSSGAHTTMLQIIFMLSYSEHAAHVIMRVDKINIRRGGTPYYSLLLHLPMTRLFGLFLEFEPKTNNDASLLTLKNSCDEQRSPQHCDK